jgi:hypothetical protein
MGHTLFLLMSALPTENVTVVLDSCFSGAATREFRVRAREGGRNALISPLEKEYQEQWLSHLDMTQEEFVAGYRRGVAKGVVLAATAPEQLAIETNLKLPSILLKTSAPKSLAKNSAPLTLPPSRELTNSTSTF